MDTRRLVSLVAAPAAIAAAGKSTRLEDMARHSKGPDPERREEAAEAPAAHACIRAGCTIR